MRLKVLAFKFTNLDLTIKLAASDVIRTSVIRHNDVISESRVNYCHALATS